MSFSGSKYVKYFLLLFVVFLVGCDLLASKPLKFLRDQVKAYNSLADAMQRVRDADSAREAAPIIELEADKLLDLLSSTSEMINKYRDTKARKTTLEQIQKDMVLAAGRVQSEMKRIDQLRGLPTEFWEVMFSVSANIVVVGLDEMRATGMFQDAEKTYDFMRHARDMMNQHGYGKMAIIRFTNLPASIAEEAYGKIKDVTGSAAMFHLIDCERNMVIVAPIDDFQAFAAKLDLGTIVRQDDTRRLLEIQVDRRKLISQEVNSALGKMLPSAAMERIQKEQEERRRKSMEDFNKRAKERIDKHADTAGLDPDAPDYYDQLAELIISGSHFESIEAMDVLLKTDPDDVESAKTRKKIARAFKEAALDKHGSNREKAIRGLARWGGKFSVPFLLDILEESHCSEKEVVFDVLGDLKDERAAAPVAARLKDFFDHDEARRCLKRMGSVAEEAVMAVAPTPNPKVCLACIEILSKIGTVKSVKFLRSAITKTRNREVKAAMKTALKNILDRQRREKSGK